MADDSDFFRWKESVYCCLRNIARSCSAWLQEPGDPAMAKTLDRLYELLEEYGDLKRAGLARGWQV